MVLDSQAEPVWCKKEKKYKDKQNKNNNRVVVQKKVQETEQGTLEMAPAFF